MRIFAKELRWDTIITGLAILVAILGIVMKVQLIRSLGIILSINGIYRLIRAGFDQKRFEQIQTEYAGEHREDNIELRNRAGFYMMVSTLVAEMIAIIVLSILMPDLEKVSLALLGFFTLQLFAFEVLYSFYKWNRW